MKKKLTQRNNSQVAAIKKKTFWKKVKDNKTLILMCLPAITFFIVFAYCPMPGAYIAFTDFNYKSGIFASRVCWI